MIALVSLQAAWYPLIVSGLRTSGNNTGVPALHASAVTRHRTAGAETTETTEKQAEKRAYTTMPTKSHLTTVPSDR